VFAELHYRAAHYDDREIGEPGEMTRKIQEIYFATVHGEVPQYKEWLEYARE